MKTRITILILINSVFLFSQELETDTTWIESESELIFKEASEITSIVYHYLELDYLIENLDTITLKDKLKREIFQEQKEQLLKEALSNYEQLITEYPTSSYYYKALNDKGIIEFEFKMYEESKESFEEILQSNVNDKEEVRVGYGLMAEPYANYRKRASEMLYKIEFAQENYEKAKKYLEKSTEYVYNHWCGNAHEEKEFWLAFQRSKIESKIGDIERATKIVLPYIFDRSLMRNQELADYYMELLLTKRTREQLIEEFDTAIKSFYKKKSNPDSKYFDYFIIFLDTELEVDIYTDETKSSEQELIREHVENQWIYYLIKSEK